MQTIKQYHQVMYFSLRRGAGTLIH